MSEDQILGESYARDAAPFELTESLPTQRFKAIGYALRKTDDSTRVDENQTFAVLLETTLNKSKISRVEQNLRLLFDDDDVCDVKVETCNSLSDKRCIITISIIDGAINRKYPANEILKHLSQPQQYQQLNQILSNKLVQLIPIQEVSEKDVEDYLDRVPDGIDPEVWEQAKQDNPDPEKFIPVPLIRRHTFNTTPRKKYNYWWGVIVLILLGVFIQSFVTKRPEVESGVRKDEMKIDFQSVEAIEQQFPNVLSHKKMRIIKGRLLSMKREVSILMLLGKSRDDHCESDPTFCIGRRIANVTQVKFGYIDASSPNLDPKQLEEELQVSLEGGRYTIMIDSLEKLPGTKVMNLFQYIDKDETNKRRGMLLFIVYTGGRENPSLNEAGIAEKILVDRWSPSVPKDSLSSVISRLCGSIVKVY